MNVADEIERERKKIAEQEGQINLMLQFKDHLETWPGYICFAGGSTRIIIKNLSELPAARRFMEVMFGTKEFNYTQAFYSGGETIATFRAKDVAWSIWLETTIANYPKELLPSDHCGWEKTETSDYNLVCKL